MTFAGAAAYFGSTCKRTPLLAALAVVAFSARTLPSLGLVGLGLLFAISATRHLRRRSLFSRGAGAGLGVLSLLASGGRLSAPHLAVVIIAVIVLVGLSGYRHSRSRQRRWIHRTALVVAAIGVVATLGALLGLVQARAHLDSGIAELRLGLASARSGDPASASSHLSGAVVHLAKARDDVSRFGSVARGIPVAGQNVGAITSVLEDVGRASLDAARAAATVTDGQLSVRSGAIDLDAVSRLAEPLARLEHSMAEVVRGIDDERRLPILPMLDERLRTLRGVVTRARQDAAVGAMATRVLPEAFGANGPKRYLVVFTSPAEARGRFGFPSSFAEVTFEHGRLSLGEHGSTSKAFAGLEADPTKLPGSDPRLRPYVPYGAATSLLSSTIPPDFPIVGQALASMWAQSGRDPVDGVIRMDPTALAPLLQFTGPVSIDRVPAPLTSDTLPDYLLVGQYVQFQQANATRREVLDTVASTTFERLVTSDLPSARDLFDLFGPLAGQGHISMWAAGDDLLDLLGRADLTGPFTQPASDGLMVTTVNMLGNKIDAFLRTDVHYAGSVRHGRAQTTATVTLTNAAPPAGLPDYVIGSFVQPGPPKGTNRSTVMVYTALPASSIDVSGSTRLSESTLVNGWWLHEISVELPPGSHAAIVLHLDGQLDGRYQLEVWPTGGTKPTSLRVDLTADGRHLAYDGDVQLTTRVR